MKLKLDQIGAINAATIDLVGLTVIAGSNDTGKSTLGKVTFSLVQALSSFPIAVKRNNSAKLRRELENIYFEIRRNFDLGEQPEIRRFFSNLRLHTDDIQDIPFADIERIIDELVEKTPVERGVSPSRYYREASLRSLLKRMQNRAQDSGTDEAAIGKLVHRALSSEFAGEIQFASSTNPSTISLRDGATTVLEMELTNSNVVKFSGGEPLGLRDATLVDGPAVLQYYPALRGYDGLDISDNRTSLSRAIPYHVVDLANKLRGAQSGLKFQSKTPGPFCSLFSGEMVFDDKKDVFFLKRGDLKIPSLNIASGIKALSIVEMLYKADYIDSDTLLILDEPETNLHPTWQIAYAKVICQLVSDGARILITTHSPYMLEALKGYCQDKVESKFYMAIKNEHERVEFIDTLGNISPIIEALSKPLSDMLESIDKEDF